MQISIFDGGLNKRVDPSLVPENQALLYSNIDNTSGVLKSAKDYTVDGREARGYFYLYNSTIYQSDADRDYLEYNKKLYWTEFEGQAGKSDGTGNHRLGIEAPVPIGALDGSGDPIFDANMSQVQGLYIQFEDFVDADFIFSKTVIEGSLPSSTVEHRIYVYIGNVLIHTADTSTVVGALSAVEFRFKTFHKYKVGRKVGADYKLIGESQGAEIVDKGQTPGATLTGAITTDTMVSQWTYTYINTTDGTESAPAPLTSETITWQLDKKVKLSNFTPTEDDQVTAIRIYRMSVPLTTPALVAEIPIDSEYYYDYKQNSDLTDLLTSYNNTPPPIGIQYITEAYGVIFAALGSRIKYTIVGKPDYWPVNNDIETGFTITGFLPIANGILVFGDSKIRLLIGDSSANFALEFISNEYGCKLHKSCKIVKNVALWIDKEGVCAWQSGYVDVISKDMLGKINIPAKNVAVDDETYWILKTDGSVLAIDFRFGKAFKEYYFADVLTDLIAKDSILYANADNKLVTLFTGADMEINYKSPEYSEGSVTLYKLYNNIFIKAIGTFKVSVLINGKKVLQKTLVDSEVPYDISPPADKQGGYHIQFIIEGKGTVKEIEWKTVPRQNR